MSHCHKIAWQIFTINPGPQDTEFVLNQSVLMTFFKHYRAVLSSILLFVFSLQSSVFAANTFALGKTAVDSTLTQWRSLSEGKPHVSAPNKPEDVIRLDQKIWIKTSTGYWQEKDPDALYVGERIYPELLNIENVNVRRSMDGRSFTVEQIENGEPSARHQFFLNPSDGIIQDIVYDREFIRVLTSEGKFLSVYMPLARTGLFNHRLPLVLNLSLSPESKTEQETTLFVVSRARKPPEVQTVSPHFFTTAENNGIQFEDQGFAPNYRFEAGDQLLMTTDGTLIGHFNVELLRAQHLMALEIIQIRARYGKESADPKAADSSDYYSRLHHELPALHASALQLKESLEAPPDRDIFYWKTWAPTFDRIKTAAQTTLAKLEDAEPKNRLQAWVKSFAEPSTITNAIEPRIPELRAAIERQDLRRFWRYILEEPQKNENLINWALEGKRPLYIGASVAAAAALVAFVTANSSYHNWGPEFLRPLSAYLTAFLPDVLLINPPNWNQKLPYSAYLVPASIFLFMMSVPLLQTVGSTVAHFMGGRHKGVDFKKGLGTMSLRVFAKITPAWYLLLPRLSRRFRVVADPLAQGFSPATKIPADSEIGRRLRLDRDIRLGELNEPVLGTNSKTEAVSLRRRAIGELVLNRERGVSLALIISIVELSNELGQSTIDLFSRIREKSPGYETIDQHLKEKIAQFMPAIQQLCRDGFFFKPIHEFTAEDFAEACLKIKAQADALAKEGKGQARIRESMNWFMDTIVRRAASWGIAPAEILTNSEIPQPIANQSWLAARTDLVFGIFLTDLVGGRANYNQPSQLAANPLQPQFLFASGPNVSDSAEQTSIYGIATTAREFILWLTDTPLEEDIYAPLDHVEMKIRGSRLSVNEQVTRGLRELFSIRGAATFADKMWAGSVNNRIDFLFASLLLSVIPRYFLADASLQDAFAGGLVCLLTAVGFNTFWWIVSILNYGADGETSRNKEKLTRVLVNLKRSIEMNDTDDQQKYHRELKELYSIVPKEYRENFDLALKLLEPQVNLPLVDVSLLAERAKPQYIAVWTEIEALKSRGLSFDQIQTQYAENPENFPDLDKKLNALRASVSGTLANKGLFGSPSEALEFAQQNTPFHTQRNWVVPELNVWILGAVGSNVVGSIIIADSYLTVSLTKFITTIALYFPVLIAFRAFFKNGIPSIVTGIEKLQFLQDSNALGKATAIKNAAMRRAENLERKMKNLALLNPLHRCQTELSRLAE